MHAAFVVLASFLACAVEMVEALTIVLAVGLTRGWRSVGIAAVAAVVLLTAVIALLGPALTRLPIDALRLVVGAILLVFGLQWLRSAILRASGLKDPHDENAAFAHELADARGAEPASRTGIDWYAFTVTFKGVFLEGLEVAFIVVTVGSSQGNIALAATGAGAALGVVAIAGAFVHRPLSRVPENALKFGVGVMLTSFGIFWSTEGAGGSWPGQDTAIVAVLAFVVLVSFGLVAWLRRSGRPARALHPAGH